MSWKIECNSKKDYKTIKERLEETDVSFKQKKNGLIKIKSSEIDNKYDLFIALGEIDFDFTLYKSHKGDLEEIHQQCKNKWLIECPNATYYTQIKNILLENDISCKQKNNNSPIIVNQTKDVQSADEVWELLKGYIFTMYEKNNENYLRICFQKDEISGVEFDENYKIPEEDNIDYAFKRHANNTNDFFDDLESEILD